MSWTKREENNDPTRKVIQDFLNIERNYPFFFTEEVPDQPGNISSGINSSKLTYQAILGDTSREHDPKTHSTFQDLINQMDEFLLGSIRNDIIKYFMAAEDHSRLENMNDSEHNDKKEYITNELRELFARIENTLIYDPVIHGYIPGTFKPNREKMELAGVPEERLDQTQANIDAYMRFKVNFVTLVKFVVFSHKAVDQGLSANELQEYRKMASLMPQMSDIMKNASERMLTVMYEGMRDIIQNSTVSQLEQESLLRKMADPFEEAVGAYRDFFNLFKGDIVELNEGLKRTKQTEK